MKEGTYLAQAADHTAAPADDGNRKAGAQPE